MAIQQEWRRVESAKLAMDICWGPKATTSHTLTSSMMLLLIGTVDMRHTGVEEKGNTTMVHDSDVSSLTKDSSMTGGALRLHTGHLSTLPAVMVPILVLIPLLSLSSSTTSAEINRTFPVL